MRFQHPTVKHLLNLVVRQYVMSQKQFLLSSKLKPCMFVLLPCKIGIVISRCVLHVDARAESMHASTKGACLQFQSHEVTGIISTRSPLDWILVHLRVTHQHLPLLVPVYEYTYMYA